MKILVVCGSGLGSSFMMEMSIKEIIKDLGVNAQVDHTDLGSAKGEGADIYIGTKDITSQLEGIDGEVISLKSMIDKADMKKQLEETFKKLGAL
ncbi:PTS sugar transporter subunit IIB [Maledivibacter halophilus]|uniref:PTS system IIB component, L-Asc family (TC 4.A.7) n=1 Tax=Maledivibacter halophilus TaxID=36842 RepID=A0A1T5L246_9FIRM|nr:PTS sugar transporter subunit IIB [Maledivibacter halophilus]SKC69980.1 PTS system IIB component, L-Asc family (TC 4.A.7) [Maledivibacter halophilus]